MTEPDSQESSDAPREEPGTEADGPTPDDGGSSNDETPPRRPRRSGGAAAWLALLLALAALGLAGYPIWQQWRAGPAEDPSADVSARLDRLEERIDSADAGRTERVETLRADLAALRSELESLKTDVRERVERIERRGGELTGVEERISDLAQRLEATRGQRQDEFGGIRARLSALESSVGERLERFEIRLEEISGERGDPASDRAERLALVEIDSLLELAQNRLEIGAGVATGRRAWRRAMESIDELPAGRYSDLRSIAQREFERMNEFRPADGEDAVRRLFRMAGEAGEWPLSASGGRSPEAPGDEAGDSDRAGWRGRLARTFDRLVQIESVDTAGLSRAERERAGERVRIALETAALALARSSTDLAETLAAEAAERIPVAFDATEPAVAEHLEWLRSFDPSSRAEPPVPSDTRRRIAELLGGRP